MSVLENRLAIQENIEQACNRAGRDPKDVEIIAVTKYVSPLRAQEAVGSGLTHLGENRLEGLLDKKKQVHGDHLRWHFIGSLQSRKVKDVIPHIDFLHSLDRMSLANEIEKRAEKRVKCFIQLNLSGETTKHGMDETALMPFIKSLERYTKIEVVGLMTMAPFTEDTEKLRGVFRRLKELQLRVEELNLPYAPCHDLSMGMSNDYPLAVEEGATFVRIGTALVGKEG